MNAEYRSLHLLEIRSSSQIETHYLRGELFENMLINELIKSEYNKGRDYINS